MGYQFAHIDSYSRTGSKTETKKKSSIKDILNEGILREKSACHHIENPQPPKKLYGCSADEILKEVDIYAENTKDSTGKKFRKDGLILLAGVFSLPREREQDFPEFEKRCVEFLKQKYGDNLKSVVSHNDESHPHIHFYVLPKIGQKFEDIHEGFKASNNAKRSGLKKGEQNRAYIVAMRKFQDEFQEKVGSKLGLTRMGPGGRRLSRAEWKREQKQAESLSNLKSIAKAGFKKGFEDGFKKGKEKALNYYNSFGKKWGSFFNSMTANSNKATKQAIEDKKKSDELAELEKKKRIQNESQIKFETNNKLTKIVNELQTVKTQNKDLISELNMTARKLEQVEIELYKSTDKNTRATVLKLKNQ